MCQSDNNTKPRGVFSATVVANDTVCSEHFRLLLKISGEFPESRPGQFVQVQSGADDSASEPVTHEWPDSSGPAMDSVRPELAEASALLRRPISIADRRDTNGQTTLELIHRVVGRGTAWLAGLPVGSEITLIGPLGNGFTLNSSPAILVGGGVGLPPMIYLARMLRDQGVECEAFVGAASADLLPLELCDQADSSGAATLCARPFDQWSVPVAITTDDGSAGLGGFVTEALSRRLASYGDELPSGLTVYTCGPDPMMKAVADICISRDIKCQVALERKMACGMGTCQSCVCKTRANNAEGWSYKLVCTDGTVFSAEDIIWD